MTRNAKDAVVVTSTKAVERLSHDRPDFKKHLRSAPPIARLRITRDCRSARKILLDSFAQR